MAVLLEAPPHTLLVIAYGTPAPQGSKIAVAKGVLRDDNPLALRTWREDVKFAALRAMEDTPLYERDYEAIRLHVVFSMARPRTHYRTGKTTSHMLRNGAPIVPITKPDLDKLVRSTMDALTAAGVYSDDCRVVDLTAREVYVVPWDNNVGVLDRPGARIVVNGVKAS